MSSLGVYFGPSLISLVETKGKKILNNLKIPLSMVSLSELEEKVPDDVKMVALFKDELRRNLILAKDATICLSGKDLIIRTFEVPLLSREDLANAINFEARKYIPFKIEELILDYQLYFDKSIQKNLVLLVGIKKEVLDKYLSIFGELNLKINSLEYAAFSTLRLLKLAGAKDKGIIALINVDLSEQDEINFSVLKNGFPLFSRDIILSGGPEGFIKSEEIDTNALLEKLRTEIRISLDYYHRKFPAKKIDNTIFIASKDAQSDLDAFAKEIGLNLQFIDTEKCVDKPIPFSSAFLKGYSCALSKIIKTPIKINLLTAKTKDEREVVTPLGAVAPIFRGLRVEPRAIILSLIICIASFVLGFYQKIPLEKRINSVIAMRPKVSAARADASYEELFRINSENKNKLDILDDIIKRQLYLTEAMDVIPRIIPKGIWLDDFSFRREEDRRVELVLKGMAYLGDNSREFELVNSFISKLKEDPIFAKYFNQININSLDTTMDIEKVSMTQFIISCRGDFRKRD